MRRSRSAVAVVVSIAVLATAPVGGQSQGSSTGAQPAAQGHVYHLTAIRAAPGRATDALKIISQSAPDGPPFSVVFRHQEGDEWDFLLIRYAGDAATVRAQTPPASQAGPSFPDVVAWHVDTYASGPSLDEFRKALNLQTPPAPNSRAIYVIGAYVWAPGHYEQLGQTIEKLAKETPGRAVTLRHIEGAPWSFMNITRYDSWRHLADEMQPPDTQGAPGPDVGLELRQHMSRHTDTIATVQAVSGR